MYQKIVKPLLIHGRESWTLNERNKSEVKAIEMGFLMRIKGQNKKHGSSGRTKYSADRKGRRGKTAELALTCTQNEREEISQGNIGS